MVNCGSLMVPAFKVKVIDAVEMLPAMTLSEKCEAAHFLVSVLEKLQVIISRTEEDIASLALQLRKEHSIVNDVAMRPLSPYPGKLTGPQADEDMGIMNEDEVIGLDHGKEVTSMAATTADSTSSNNPDASGPPLILPSGSAVILVPAHRMTPKQLQGVVQFMSAKGVFDNEPMETGDDLKGLRAGVQPAVEVPVVGQLLDKYVVLPEELISSSSNVGVNVVSKDENMEAHSELGLPTADKQTTNKNAGRHRLWNVFGEKYGSKKKFFGAALPFLLPRGCHQSPFVCPKCNSIFTSRSHLQVHLKSHHEQKPYGCPLCKLKFTSTSDTKEHLNNHVNQLA